MKSAFYANSEAVSRSLKLTIFKKKAIRVTWRLEARKLNPVVQWLANYQRIYWNFSTVFFDDSRSIYWRPSHYPPGIILILKEVLKYHSLNLDPLIEMQWSSFDCIFRSFWILNPEASNTSRSGYIYDRSLWPILLMFFDFNYSSWLFTRFDLKLMWWLISSID